MMRMTRLDGRHANAEVMTVLSVFLGDEITLHGHKVWLGLPEVYQTKAHKALQAAAQVCGPIDGDERDR